MLDRVLAPLSWDSWISAKPIVLRLVNCIDRNKPPGDSTATRVAFGVGGVNRAQANIVTAASRPFAISTVRNPKRRSTGVVAGFIRRLPAKTAKTSRPEVKAFMPKPVWNMSGSRKGVAPIAMRNREPPQIVTAKVGTRSEERLMSG